MLLDQRITQIIADLGCEATTGPLAPQRLVRLQTLNKDLMEETWLDPPPSPRPSRRRL
jgi:hypothetical protein